MAELIAAIILLLSVIGIAVIVFRKIPVLAEFPEIAGESLLRNFWQKLKEKIKNLPFLKSFSSEIFIQKILSKIRVLTLKIEHKTGNLLQKLREKSQKKNNLKKDNYWQGLKKPKDQEDRQE